MVMRVAVVTLRPRYAQRRAVGLREFVPFNIGGHTNTGQRNNPCDTIRGGDCHLRQITHLQLHLAESYSSSFWLIQRASRRLAVFGAFGLCFAFAFTSFSRRLSAPAAVRFQSSLLVSVINRLRFWTRLLVSMMPSRPEH